MNSDQSSNHCFTVSKGLQIRQLFIGGNYCQIFSCFITIVFNGCIQWSHCMFISAPKIEPKALKSFQLPNPIIFCCNMWQAIIKMLKMDAQQETSTMSIFHSIHNWSISKIIFHIFCPSFQTLISCFDVIDFNCVMKRSSSISIGFKSKIFILEQTAQWQEFIAQQIEDRDSFFILCLKVNSIQDSQEGNWILILSQLFKRVNDLIISIICFRCFLCVGLSFTGCRILLVRCRSGQDALILFLNHGQIIIKSFISNFWSQFSLQPLFLFFQQEPLQIQFKQFSSHSVLFPLAPCFLSLYLFLNYLMLFLFWIQHFQYITLKIQNLSFFAFQKEFMNFGPISSIFFYHLSLFSQQIFFIRQFQQDFRQILLFFKQFCKFIVFILQIYTLNGHLQRLLSQCFWIYLQKIVIDQVFGCFKVLVRFKILIFFLVLSKNKMFPWLGLGCHLK